MSLSQYKYDPDTTDTRENAYGKIGWKGSFPSTPCRFCGHEWFEWIGVWGFGYRCADCRRTWYETP